MTTKMYCGVEHFLVTHKRKWYGCKQYFRKNIIDQFKICQYEKLLRYVLVLTIKHGGSFLHTASGIHSKAFNLVYSSILIFKVCFQYRHTTAASSSNSSYFTFEAPWLLGMECTMTFSLLRRAQGTRMTDRRKENTKPKLLQQESCDEITAPHWQVLLPAIWKLVTMTRSGKQHHFHYLTISVTPMTSMRFCGLLITVNSSYTHNNNESFHWLQINCTEGCYAEGMKALSCALQQVTILNPIMNQYYREQRNQ